MGLAKRQSFSVIQAQAKNSQVVPSSNLRRDFQRNSKKFKSEVVEDGEVEGIIREYER